MTTQGTAAETSAASASPARVVVLNYVLCALSRVSAGRSGEVSFNREIHEVLPGSAVRGALATAWLNGQAPQGASTAEFCDLFERSLVVRPAVPVDMSLMAMSERRCKYPLPAEQSWTSPCEVGIDDAAAYDEESRPSMCPVAGCGGGLESGRGYGRLTVGSGERTRTVAVVRTALNDDGIAEDEQLFTRRALERGARLEGSLILINPDRFDAELQWLLEPRQLRIGGQRSVLGLMSWTASVIETKSSPRPPERAVLRFTSPGILVDDYGAATLDPEATLRRLWPEASVERSRWVRPVRVGGWHAASGLPKPEDWAVEAGSTFLVRGMPADAADRLTLGIGLRRLEGYGGVQLLDPATLPRFNRPAATTRTSPIIGGEPVPPETAHGPAQDETVLSEAVRVLNQLKAVVPDDVWPTILQPLGAGVLKVQLAQAAGITGSMLEDRRGDVLSMPWAQALGEQARGLVRELLTSSDLRDVRRALTAEREANR